VYICLVFLVTHQDPHSSFIPQISLIMAWVLVVLSFGFLVYYSHRVALMSARPGLRGGHQVIGVPTAIVNKPFWRYHQPLHAPHALVQEK
jgi:hypothetical protein